MARVEEMSVQSEVDHVRANCRMVSLGVVYLFVCLFIYLLLCTSAADGGGGG